MRPHRPFSRLVPAALALTLVRCALNTSGSLDDEVDASGDPAPFVGGQGGATLAAGGQGLQSSGAGKAGASGGAAKAGAGGAAAKAGAGGAAAKAGAGGVDGQGGAGATAFGGQAGASGAPQGGNAGFPGGGGQAAAPQGGSSGLGGLAGQGAQAGQGGAAGLAAQGGAAGQAGLAGATGQAGQGGAAATAGQAGAGQAGSGQAGAGQAGSGQAGQTGGPIDCGDGLVDKGEQCDPGQGVTKLCAGCQFACPPGMVMGTDAKKHCYGAFTGPPDGLSFTEANKTCSDLSTELGGYCHLVTFTDDKERTMVLALLQGAPGGSFWVGARHNSLVRGSEPAFHYTTWEPFPFGPTYAEWSAAKPGGAPWAMDQPNGSTNDQRCLELEVEVGFKLNDAVCSQGQGYVCECEPPRRKCNFDGKIGPEEECDDGNATPGDGCDRCRVECPTPAGVTTVGKAFDPETHHCYLHIADTKSFDDARAACTALGPGFALATIESFREHAFVAASFDTSSDTWVDANDRDTEGTFVTSSGAAFPFAKKQYPWDDNQPDDYFTEDCVAYKLLPGRFNDRSCGDKLRFVCERTPAGAP